MNDQIAPARTVIQLTAEPGSSIFDVYTENCDPVQLWGAARLIEMMGNQQWAAMQRQIAEQMRNGEKPAEIEIAQAIPTNLRGIFERGKS